MAIRPEAVTERVSSIPLVGGGIKEQFAAAVAKAYRLGIEEGLAKKQQGNQVANQPSAQVPNEGAGIFMRKSDKEAPPTNESENKPAAKASEVGVLVTLERELTGQLVALRPRSDGLPLALELSDIVNGKLVREVIDPLAEGSKSRRFAETANKIFGEASSLSYVRDAYTIGMAAVLWGVNQSGLLPLTALGELDEADLAKVQELGRRRLSSSSGSTTYLERALDTQSPLENQPELTDFVELVASLQIQSKAAVKKGASFTYEVLTQFWPKIASSKANF